MNQRVCQLFFVSIFLGVCSMKSLVFDRDYFDFLLASGKVHEVDEYFHSHSWSSMASKSPFDAASPIEHRQSLEWLEEQAFKKGHIHMIYRLFERFAYYHGTKQEVSALRAYKCKLYKYKLVALKLLNSYQEHFSKRATMEDNTPLLLNIVNVILAYTSKFDAQPIDWSDVPVKYQNVADEYAEKRARKITNAMESVLSNVETTLPVQKAKRFGGESTLQSSQGHGRGVEEHVELEKEVLGQYLYHVYWLRHIVPSRSYGGSWSLTFNDTALEDSLVQAGVLQGPFTYKSNSFEYVDSDMEEEAE